MEFAYRRQLILPIVLLCVSAAAQVSEASRQVRVLVFDNARISPGLLEQAGFETTRIFRSAGIELVWISCTAGADGSACRSRGKNKELMLRVVPKGKSAGDTVYGDAFLAEDGSGKYADIFFDRIASTQHDFGVNASRLMGAIAAHEIGHLLLGLGAHSATGIMSPVWANEVIQKVERGALVFTPAQAMLMRKRLGQPEFETDDRPLEGSNVVDVGEQASPYNSPFTFKLTSFFSGTRCVQTLSACP
jgi:hypothetical protein